MAGLKVLLSGATSFTGAHIARAFLDAGHEILATLTRPPGDYESEPEAGRLRYAEGVHKVYRAPFGSENFRDALRDFHPRVFVNHGAEIRGYRDPSFDPQKALHSATQNLGQVLADFKDAGGARVLHTGTVFEPIDGLPAQSPYGFAKTSVAEAFSRSCAREEIEFTKILVANPVGPFENPDRLIPIFVRAWKAGSRPTLSAPQMLWDNIPAPWLARRYVEAAEAGRVIALRRPSGYRIPLKNFIDLFISQARHRGVEDCLEYGVPGEIPPAPTHPRFNTEPCSELSSSVEVEAFFDFWICSLWPGARRS